MDSQRFIDLTGQKLAGTISPEDTKSLDQELDTNPEAQEQFEYLKDIWETSGKLGSNINLDLEKSWTEFKELRQKPKAQQVVFWPWVSTVAASILLVVGAFLFFSIEETRYSTLPNEIKKVNLPDGSMVTLRGASTLTYDEGFFGNRRDVDFTGQAFFEVARDEERAFIIESLGSVTRVLGTSFDLQAYPDLGQVNINVVSGRVEFSNTKKGMVLTKGLSAALDRKTQSIHVKESNINDLSWNTQLLEFDDATMDEVVRDLINHFNIGIILETKTIGNCRFTGKFDQPTLDEIFQALELTLNIKINEVDKQYILAGKGCN